MFSNDGRSKVSNNPRDSASEVSIPVFKIIMYLYIAMLDEENTIDIEVSMSVENT